MRQVKEKLRMRLWPDPKDHLLSIQSKIAVCTSVCLCVGLPVRLRPPQLGLDPETYGPLPSLSWGGSDDGLDQTVSKLETKSGCEISF